MQTKRIIITLTAGVLLLQTGCAVTKRQPLVYYQPPGRNYQTDHSECEAYAAEATRADPSVNEGATNGSIGGALMGAAFGALIGGMVGHTGYGALYGAQYGSMRGSLEGAAANASELTRREQTAVLMCLHARGYSDATY